MSLSSEWPMEKLAGYTKARYFNKLQIIRVIIIDICPILI